MTDAGILLGLPRQVAHDLIVQTAIGSAIMLRDSGEHPVQAARGRHLAGRHHHLGHPGAGEPRRTRGAAGRAGGGPRPGPGTGRPERLSRRVCRDEPRRRPGALAALRPRIDDFLAVRADLAELRADLATTGTSPLGGAGRRQGAGGAAATPTSSTSPRSAPRSRASRRCCSTCPGSATAAGAVVLAGGRRAISPGTTGPTRASRVAAGPERVPALGATVAAFGRDPRMQAIRSLRLRNCGTIADDR